MYIEYIMAVMKVEADMTSITASHVGWVVIYMSRQSWHYW